MAQGELSGALPAGLTPNCHPSSELCDFVARNKRDRFRGEGRSSQICQRGEEEKGITSEGR